MKHSLRLVLKHALMHVLAVMLAGFTLLAGQGQFMPAAQALTVYQSPAAPSNLRAQFDGLQKIALKWQDNATNETYQQIWVSTDGSSYSKLANIGANVVGYVQDLGKPASAGSLYYAVRAVNSVGTSSFVRGKITLSPVVSTSGSSIATEVLTEVNKFRAQNSLPPLSNSTQLQQAAQRHSDNMAVSSTMSHNCTDGTTFSQRISQSGYIWRSIAENVAAGQTSAQQVMQAWINSPGHRANMLKSDVKDAGIGYNNRYWTLDLAG